jgi:hypothetical protein
MRAGFWWETAKTGHGRMILKWLLKNRTRVCGLDVFGSEQGVPVAGCDKKGFENQSSIK